MPYQSAPFASRAEYAGGGGGAIVILDLSIPIEPPDHDVRTIGGSRIATSGVGAGFIKRTDRLATFDLFATTDELPAADAWLLWAMLPHRTFHFTFDREQPATRYLCYLDSPTAGQTIAWRRSRDYIDAFQTSITLRSATGVPLLMPVL